MNRLIRRALLASVALSAGLLVGVTASPASGGTLSEGCATANDPLFDGWFGGAGTTASFSAGERITVTASEPTSYGTATTFTLYALPSYTILATATFPGTITYTFPADTPGVFWEADLDEVTWTISCEVPPPLPTSTDQCKNGRYEAFGFKNQGDCVSFVTTAGKNEPAKNAPSAA